MKNKRYNLSLPQYLFDELKMVSKIDNTTVLQLITTYIRLGLTLRKSTGELFIKDGKKETKIIIF